MANVVLPVPGGPNSTIARGGMTPYSSARSGSTSGSTTRRSMSSFSCSMPASALPQAAREHPPAERLEQPDLLWLERHDALEVREVARLVAGVAERPRAGLALDEQRRQAVDAARDQARLELGEHRAADARDRASRRRARAGRSTPRSPNTRATAAPTTTSPTVMTTAVPPSRSAPSTSDSPYTAGRSGLRDSSQTRTTWSRSSSWNSRTRGVDIG